MLKLHLSSIGKGKIFFYKNTYLTYSKNSIISADKGFYFNKSWNGSDSFPSSLFIGENAKLLINGSFIMYSGSRVSIEKDACLILGSGFINHNLNLCCFNKIEIGNNVIISDNATIRDSDNHYITHNNGVQTKPIKIGNNVWIGMNCTILKGVSIGDGAVIAAGSLVNKDVPSRCLAGGVPSKILKENIDWVR